MRIGPFIVTALPAQNWAHNLAIVDNIFNALIASLSAFTNLFD